MMPYQVSQLEIIVLNKFNKFHLIQLELPPISQFAILNRSQWKKHGSRNCITIWQRFIADLTMNEFS